MVNDAVRRIMAEVRELAREARSGGGMFVAAPLEGDLFEWHFSVRGPADTAFEGGVYHGRILLPAEYPLKPPEIMLLTANGRFELNTPICLSVTAHHQETWQPSWGIRTILTALVGFMPSAAEGLGSLDFPDVERRRLATRSRSFVCPRCGVRPSDQLPGSAPRALGTARAAPAAAAGPVAAAAAPAAATAAQATARAVPAPAAANVAVQHSGAQSGGRRPAVRGGAQDRGLLVATYTILALIVAIVVRRML